VEFTEYLFHLLALLPCGKRSSGGLWTLRGCNLPLIKNEEPCAFATNSIYFSFPIYFCGKIEQSIYNFRICIHIQVTICICKENLHSYIVMDVSTWIYFSIILKSCHICTI
jgi:hypothetical protein